MSTVISQYSLMSLFLRTRFNGQEISSGTGFLVYSSAQKPYFITNRHNVTGRHQDTGELLSTTGAIPNEFLIYHNHTARVGSWIEKIEPLFDSNEVPRWIEHPVLGSRADFVALPLSDLEGVSIIPYSLEEASPAIAYGPADRLNIIGFPFAQAAGGLFAIWVTGFVASEPPINYRDLPLFLIDSRTRPGQSGSPVIVYYRGGMVRYEDGNVVLNTSQESVRLVGIYSGRINKESDIGFVWKTAAIKELVDSIPA